MADYDYELFVIGAGSGGVRAARLAAELGVKVGIAEEYRIGGTCVIRGCVPKKLLVYGSRYAAAFADAASYGWTFDNLKFDWPTLIGNVRREVDRLNGVYTRTLENIGVDRFLTRAVLEDAHTVRLADPDKTITAKIILIATGGHPIIPDVPGKEHLISSNECFQLEALPDSIVIVGAGYIAMEFASIFNGLGVHVTVLYRGDQILRDFDDDLRNGLAAGDAESWHRPAHECRYRSGCEGRGWLSRQAEGWRLDQRWSGDGGDGASAEYGRHGTGGCWGRAWLERQHCGG